MHWTARLTVAMGWALAVAGCATRSGDVAPLMMDASTYSSLRCDELHDESDRLRQRAAAVAFTLDERSGANIVALGLGVTVFWPALVAMRPVGPDAQALAELRGRDDAVQRALSDKACPPASPLLDPARAAVLPIVMGERLVYEERGSGRRAARELGLRVAALRRGEIEFEADEAGRKLVAPWVQDPWGNQPRAVAGSGWLVWRRLLREDMALGDTLAGELVAPGLQADPLPDGRVRGQVIALGVKHSLGRPFDAAVIELFGEVPHGNHMTRLDGVMVVDRKSGVLLRLELRSANPDFSLRRTLVRIETPLPAAR